MASIKTIDKEIAGYWPQLNDIQKEAVLGVVKTFAAEKEEYDRWHDKTLLQK